MGWWWLWGGGSGALGVAGGRDRSSSASGHPADCTSAHTRCSPSVARPHLPFARTHPRPCRYVNEYVLCNSCKSPDTLLDRDSATRIMFLRCQQCGASRTVSAIKAGFQARTVSRKSQQTG